MGGGGNIEDFSNAVVIRLQGSYTSVQNVLFIGASTEHIKDNTYVYKNLSSVSKDESPAIVIMSYSGNYMIPTSAKIYLDGVELDFTKVEIRADGLILFTPPLFINNYNTVEAIIEL